MRQVEGVESRYSQGPSSESVSHKQEDDYSLRASPQGGRGMRL